MDKWVFPQECQGAVVFSYVNCLLLSVWQNREALISPQCGSVSLTGQKLETVLCRILHASVVWAGLLRLWLLKSQVPQNSKVEHSTIQQSVCKVEKSRLQRDWLDPCGPRLIFSTVEKTG